MDTNIPFGKGAPKKYIRTLESDMATLKKGGVPDLTPFAKSPITINTTKVTPALDLEKVKSLPPPPPPPPPPVQKLEPPPIKSPEPVRSTSIETYASDFSNRMKETHASMATVLAAEQDSLQVASQTTPQKSSHNNLLYIIAGTLLLIAGMGGAYVAYMHYMKITAPVVLIPSASAPIFVDDREQISGTGPILMQAIEESVNRPLAQGAVRLLYTASSTDNTESIFSALNVPAPDILLRNIQAAGSMAGVINVGGKQSPFFILSVLSYRDTFSGMLSWESSIRSDLGLLFPPYPTATSTVTSIPILTTTLFLGEHGEEVRLLQQAFADNGLLSVPPTGFYGPLTEKAVEAFQSAHSIISFGSPFTTGYGSVGPKTLAEINMFLATTTTTAISPTLSSTVFSDETIANHDVRVYRDSTGKSILLYGYWDQKTLIIARDPAAFTEILQRLATSRT